MCGVPGFPPGRNSDLLRCGNPGRVERLRAVRRVDSGTLKCPLSIFSPSRTCRKRSARRKSSRTSGCRSIRGPRSASSGGTARARARCCGSWRGWTTTSWGPRGRRRGPRSATCRRSRRSTPTLDVRGNVEQAVAPTRALLARFDAINARLGEPIDADEMDKLLEEQAKVQDAIEAAQRLGPRPPDRDRHGRDAAAAGRRRRRHALRRRAAPRRALQDPAASGPTSCCSTSRRTTSTPRASPGSNGTWPSIPGRSSP